MELIQDEGSELTRDGSELPHNLSKSALLSVGDFRYDLGRDTIMPRTAISELIMQQLQDHEAHSIEEVVDATIRSSSDVYESEIKSTVLGLVRRNRLELSDDFKLSLPSQELELCTR